MSGLFALQMFQFVSLPSSKLQQNKSQTYLQKIQEQRSRNAERMYWTYCGNKSQGKKCIALQNKEVQRLKDANQKKNNKFKSEKILNSVVEDNKSGWR